MSPSLRLASVCSLSLIFSATCGAGCQSAAGDSKPYVSTPENDASQDEPDANELDAVEEPEQETSFIDPDTGTKESGVVVVEPPCVNANLYGDEDG
ncbi:MAG TPA: hypothetical protein PLJ27_25420, partial [Polyangiaceae bacterium]|nr:hypothetical protein [Polyangiaceae bacterium]